MKADTVVDGFLALRVRLARGLSRGGEWHRDALVREANMGEVSDAAIAAAGLTQDEGARALLEEILIVGRQVIQVGDIKGPLTLGEMKLLSSADFRLLRTATERLGHLALAQVEEEGAPAAAADPKSQAA